jgi:alpha/beta superfamily hydrolase
MRLTKAVDLYGPVGRLEAILMSPAKRPIAAAVICHAHPLYGGTMHMKVVFRIAKALQQSGIATLRFNFRGVGRSQGSHDEGMGEREDVRAALDEMSTRYPDLPLVLGGFSFGSTMALMVGQQDQRVRALLVIGFPVSLVPSLSFVERVSKPRLFVQCDFDEFGSGHRMRELVESLPEPHTLVVLPEGDHLFNGRLDELEKTVARWSATHPWESQMPFGWDRS